MRQKCIRLLLRPLLAFLLSFSITFSGTDLGLLFAAQTSKGQAPTSGEQKEQDINQLRKAFKGQSVAHLDQFHLTGQKVVDYRHKQVNAVVKEAKLKDYLDRLNHLEEKQEALLELLNKLKVQQQSVVKKEAKRLLSIKQDLQSRIKLNQLELKDAKAFDPRKGKAFEVDWMIDESLKPRHYWGSKMGLKIYQNSKVVKEISQTSFTESLSPLFFKNNPLEGLVGQGPLTFSITDNKGVVLHEFLRPVVAVFFFGQYLVYIEKKSISKQSSVLPVRFIDLNYFKSSIGNAPLPVFTFPVNLKESSNTFNIKKAHLNIAGQRLAYEQFALLSKLYQIVFNVSVSLVDGESYKNVEPLIKDIARFFNLSMKEQSKLFQSQMNKAIDFTSFSDNLVKGVDANAKAHRALLEATKSSTENKDFLKNILSDGQITDAEYAKLTATLNIKKDLSSTNKALYQGRKLLTRINLLSRFLISPRPEGSPKIFKSLVALASKGVSGKSELWRFSKNNFYIKIAKYGLAAGGVALAASHLPEPYTLHLYKSLDLISAIGEHFKAYLSHINYGFNYADLSKDALITSTTGWTQFVSTYFADGVGAKFLYGLGQVLMVPLQLFAGIHLSINSFKMFSKSRVVYKEFDKKDKSFIKAFVTAAQRESTAYWSRLSDAEKEVSGSDVSVMSAEEEKLLAEHLQRLTSKNTSLNSVENNLAQFNKKLKSPLLKSYIRTIKDYTQKLKFSKNIKSVFKSRSEDLGLKNTFSFRKALSQAFLSFSSLSETFKFNASVWGYLFVGRSFFFSPSKWLMGLIYPNYFKVSVTGKTQHFPSRFNGGLETSPQSLKRLLSKGRVGSSLRKLPVLKNILLSPQALKNLNTLENSVLPLEALAIEVSMKRAQIALIKQVKDVKRLQVLFDSAQRESEVSTGIKNFYDKKIKQLTKKEKTFFRAYFTRSFDLIMQDFLSQVTKNKKLNSVQDPDTFSKQFVKNLRKENFIFDLSQKSIDKVSKGVESRIDFESIQLWSENLSQKTNLFTTRVKNNFRHKLLQSLHPDNPQIKRFLIGKKKIQEPKAMERAVRKEVSSMVSAIPIGILSSLALYAGVKTGLLVPFDPEGLDTETHRNYMSRYLFYTGFIPSIIVGLMSSTWMKVQEDYRIDSLGGFNKMVSHADGQKGFWRYYLKNFFKNPKNKWKSNQIFMLKIITANLPAAAVTIAVSNLYGLGRIDLGSFLASYLIAYSTVLYGLNVKMEQAFELASSWVNSKIPRRLRAHPEAQKYISKNLQKRKILFSIMDSFWDVLVLENIAGTMLTLKDNVKYGTRAFLRLVFGGELPTVLFANFIESVSSAFKSIWGVETFFTSVKNLFTNNYEITQRYPKELLEAGKGVERLQEIKDLSANKLAEFVGKSSAAMLSIGAFISVPYVASEWLDKRKRQRLQNQGLALRLKCSDLFN